MNTDNHLVAVYGTLRQGNSNHRLLAKARFCDKHVLSLPATMYTLGAFPGIVFNKEENGPIVVEVYEVTKPEFRKLDSLEGFPNFYNRKRVSTPVGDAWIYYLDDIYSNNQEISTGDWMDYLASRPKFGNL